MQDAKFEPDLETVLKRAKQAGVNSIITAGVDLEDSRKALQLSELHSILHPVVGLAPYSDQLQIDDVLTFITEAGKKIVGVGEIGLDYPWKKRPEQVEPFRKQIQLAKDLGLPVTVHSRSAGKYVLDILEEEQAEKVHLHSFGGSKQDLKRIVDLGYFVSITCRVITSERLQNLAKILPEELILLETDSPVLSASEGRNEPAKLVESLNFLSKLLNIDAKELEKLTEKNSKRVFGQNI
ncbi:MAG: TatD family hydrolase [Candidatus Altiarchaeota archaeon]|nr:TatD family hydrolase [Candidatus Altiarchaeota archaeon]